MGVNYYAVKGSEKVYVGRNIIDFTRHDMTITLNKLTNYIDMEPEYDELGKPVKDLTVEDYGKMSNKILLFYDMVELFSHPLLLSFLLTHQHDDDIDKWEIKSDYELDKVNSDV